MFVTVLSVVGKEDPVVIVYDNDGVKYWNLLYAGLAVHLM